MYRFLDHYLTVFCLVAGLTGLDRGVRCVAGNLLGCSAQLVDRCSDVVGPGALLIETDDGRVRGVDHPLRQVMHLKRCGGHFDDGRVHALHELIERATQRCELVLALNAQAPGQITLALGDVLHRTPHVGQRAHQRTNEQAQQQRNHGHCNQHGNHRRAAKLAQWRIGLVLVDRQANVPVSRGQPGDRGK